MSEEAPHCFLCGRLLGERVEWHHPVCHRAFHRALDNKALARDYSSPAALRAHPELARFVDWVSGKDPDFHVPTRRAKR